MVDKSIYRYVLVPGILLASMFFGAWYFKIQNNESSLPQTKPQTKNGDAPTSVTKDEAVHSYVDKTKEQLVLEIQNSYSINDYKKNIENLKTLIQELLGSVDLVERVALERELSFLQVKLDNAAQSYDEKIQILLEVALFLESVKKEFTSKEYNSSITEIIKGDTASANKLLSKVDTKYRVTLGGDGFDLAARAVYLQGKIAESQIDYRRAFHYYRQAVKYDPENIAYLSSAGKIADNIALYSKAVMYFEAALYNSREQDGESSERYQQLLISLGKVWESKGDAKKAKAYLERVSKLK